MHVSDNSDHYLVSILVTLTHHNFTTAKSWLTLESSSLSSQAIIYCENIAYSCPYTNGKP